MNARIDALSTPRSLVRGIFWNALGRGPPILAALVATPVLLSQLGVDRWGLFTLASGIIGSFGMLDFGVSAALTRALAERIGTENEQDAAALVITALALLLLTSLAGSVVAFAAVPWFVGRILHVPQSLHGEVILTFKILAASGPLIVVNAALWGVLAAYQRFRAANLIGIPCAVVCYVGPILSLMIQGSLAMAILPLVAARMIQSVVYAILAIRLIPTLRCFPRPRLSLLRDLVRIGAWMTVSNTLAPLMTYVDRFIVGATASLAAVSYYTTPVDFMWRVTLVPLAVMTALFPAVASIHQRDPKRIPALMRTGSLVVIVTVFPACVAMVGLGRELMTLWLGAPFATESHLVLILVGGGVFFSCLAGLPSSMLDGVGRPEIGAFFLIAQAILFPPAIAGMALAFGIQGAAAIWALRAILNYVGRLYVCGRVIPFIQPAAKSVFGVSLVGGGALLACALLGPLSLKLAAMGVAALGVPLLAAGRLLEGAEIARLRQALHVVLRPLHSSDRIAPTRTELRG